ADRRRRHRVRRGRRSPRDGAIRRVGRMTSAEATPGTAPAVPPGRVLVVDDSRMNRLTLARLLEQLGHAVVEAEDGREALDRLASGGAIDLVLLDVVMPVLAGFQTLEAMKADPALAAIPVVGVYGR